MGVLGEWDNPYLTMAPGNEADELRVLGRLLEKGYVFRGLKPVNWCFDCGSALAEAEVEYADKTDIAVDVGFPFMADQLERLAAAFGLPALPTPRGFAVIWTTTPWTLPANQALNLHPEIRYALVATEWQGAPALLVLAAERVQACLTDWKLEGQVLATCPGSALELIRFKHPFYDRASPVYLGEYVTLDTGTGVVHSSPAYGVEDFLSCKRYGMADSDVLQPVLGDGVYAESLPLFGGQFIWKANPAIVEHIRAQGHLFSATKYVHSYMHCWRHKTPIIYRASSQWFAGMDVTPKDGGATLRATALKAVEATDFYPGWGKARLHGMIANRPDWTLSRQRQWGVPMAFFVHRETGELHPRTAELLEVVAQRIEAEGIEAWQRLDPRELLGEEADQYQKNRDTLDVWFDSGSTHITVLRGSHQAQSHFPADMYLEGSDQHRGWFHSSLLTASMTDGRAPYKALLTHGFVIDGEGRKMSKSMGNVIAAAKDLRHPGRRDSAAVGRLHRLFGRAVAVRRDPQARRRELPAHSQYAALPAGQRGRLQSVARRGAGRSDARDRPLRDGPCRAVAGRPGGLAGQVRVPSGGRRIADVLFGRSRRVLPRHPQGPAVHHGHWQRRTAFSPDRVAPHHQRSAAPDGADPLVHRRRSLAAVRAGPAPRARRDHLHPDVSRLPPARRRPRAAAQVGTHPRSARAGSQGAGGQPHHRRDRLLAAGRSRADRQPRGPCAAGHPGR
jgi:hypothetical protein